MKRTCTVAYDCDNCPKPDCVSDFDNLKAEKRYLARHGAGKEAPRKKLTAEQKARQKVTQAKWHEAHMEEMRAYRKAYYQAHKEKINEKARKWYETHREEMKAYHKAYYQANKEEIHARRRANIQKAKLKEAIS